MTEHKPKLLVVDDEAAIGQILKAGLEMHGFTVRYEPHSTDTIQTCLEFHPDIVLLDVDMPVKDGGDVAAELRSHPTLWRIPVIFLTSLASKEKTPPRKDFCELFLSKQLSITELVARIHAGLPPPTAH